MPANDYRVKTKKKNWVLNSKNKTCKKQGVFWGVLNYKTYVIIHFFFSYNKLRIAPEQNSCNPSHFAYSV